MIAGLPGQEQKGVTTAGVISRFRPAALLWQVQCINAFTNQIAFMVAISLSSGSPLDKD